MRLFMPMSVEVVVDPHLVDSNDIFQAEVAETLLLLSLNLQPSSSSWLLLSAPTRRSRDKPQVVPVVAASFVCGDIVNGDDMDTQNHICEASKDSSVCTSIAMKVSSECSSRSGTESPAVAVAPPLKKKKFNRQQWVHTKAPFSHELMVQMTECKIRLCPLAELVECR